MLKLKIATMAQDEFGHEVFLIAGTQVSEISDAGPVLNPEGKGPAFYGPDNGRWVGLEGWQVIFKAHHPGQVGMNELVSMDAVKLLKALE